MQRWVHNLEVFEIPQGYFAREATLMRTSRWKLFFRFLWCQWWGIGVASALLAVAIGLPRDSHTLDGNL
jgi:hypothetical protein